MHYRKQLNALSLLLVPAALLLLSTPAFCLGPNAPKPQPSREASDEIQAHQAEHQAFSKQLGLSPEQAKKVNAIMEEGHRQSRALKVQLRAKRQALMQYLPTPNATQSQALALNAELNALQRQISELRLKTFFAMRAQLTPEQLQKLSQLKQREGTGEKGHQGFWGHDDSGRPNPQAKSGQRPARLGR
jgi:Spy/CpxP family protein refolding chaperone